MVMVIRYSYEKTEENYDKHQSRKSVAWTRFELQTSIVYPISVVRWHTGLVRQRFRVWSCPL